MHEDARRPSLWQIAPTASLIVEHEWPRIERLARALLKRRTLDYAAVVDLLLPTNPIAARTMC